MKSLLRLSPIAVAALALFGCDQLQQPPETEPGVDGLMAVHVGGHLGSYRDCPEQAFENLDQAPRAAIRDGAQSPDADCDGNCAPLNCEAARLTVTLANDSDAVAEGIAPVALFILDRDGLELVELPIAATLDGEGLPFDGDLEPGEEALVHIEFAGPQRPWDYIDANARADGDRAFQQNDGLQLRLLVGSTTHDDTGLDTPVLYSLPEVDT